MVQLHCPRCELLVPVRAEGATPRVCPRCAETSKVHVPLAATATIPRPQPPRAA
jgi:phage FluMu protein Com